MQDFPAAWFFVQRTRFIIRVCLIAFSRRKFDFRSITRDILIVARFMIWLQLIIIGLLWIGVRIDLLKDVILVRLQKVQL